MLFFEYANTKTRRKDIFNINHKVQLAAKLERKKRGKKVGWTKNNLRTADRGLAAKKSEGLETSLLDRKTQGHTNFYTDSVLYS